VAFRLVDEPLRVHFLGLVIGHHPLRRTDLSGKLLISLQGQGSIVVQILELLLEEILDLLLSFALALYLVGVEPEVVGALHPLFHLPFLLLHGIPLLDLLLGELFLFLSLGPLLLLLLLVLVIGKDPCFTPQVLLFFFSLLSFSL